MGYARIAIIIGVLVVIGLFFTSTIYAGNYSEEIPTGVEKIVKKIPGFAENQIDSDYLDVIITFKIDVSVNDKGITSLSESSKDIKKMPMEIKHNLPIINAVSATIHKDELEAIQNLPYVASVEMNAKRYALLNETIPLINADDLWDNATFNLTGSGVKVCIIDTGYDFFHSNLPIPNASVDFTDWDWCIDGRASSASSEKSYNYSLNITNSTLDWLEVGVNWIYGNNRYDIFVYDNNSNLANSTIVSVENEVWSTTNNATNEQWNNASNETNYTITYTNFDSSSVNVSNNFSYYSIWLTTNNATNEQWNNASNETNYTITYTNFDSSSVVIANDTTVLDSSNYTVYNNGKIILTDASYIGENLTINYTFFGASNETNYTITPVPSNFSWVLVKNGTNVLDPTYYLLYVDGNITLLNTSFIGINLTISYVDTTPLEPSNYTVYNDGNFILNESSIYLGSNLTINYSFYGASNVTNYTMGHILIVPGSVIVKNDSTTINPNNYTVYHNDGKIILAQPSYIGTNLTINYSYRYGTTYNNSGTELYWVKLNLTNTSGNNGTWTIVINETDINSSVGDYPTLVWGSNVSYNIGKYYQCNDTYCPACGSSPSPISGSVIDSRAFYNIHPQDDYGHGTHVAGIIASNNTTYKGVAPNVDLYIAKVLDTDGSGTTTSVIDGIQWCINQSVDVISISLGGAATRGCNDSDALAVDNATMNSNILSVIAAGNSGPGTTTINSPGCARTALTVGATEKNIPIHIYTNSSRGPTNDTFAGIKPEIVAPGYSVFSTYITNKFLGLTGTSMATPHVTGAAALLLQRYPNLTAAEIKVMLMNSANNSKVSECSATTLDNTCGSGFLDILEAVNKTWVLSNNISSGAIRSYTFNAAPTTAKATLYWEEYYNASNVTTHYSMNLSLQRWSGTSWVQVDTSTNTSWVTQQVGATNSSSKWKVLVGGVTVTGNKTFYLATSSFVYPTTTLKLNSPTNNTKNNTGSVLFNYTINSTNLSHCMLWIANASNLSTWHANLTSDTPTNNSINLFTKNFTDGSYIWNIECNGTYLDTAFSDFNETNRTFIIDSTAPNVTINLPVQGANLTGTFMLNWTINDLTFNKTWYLLDNSTTKVFLVGSSNTTNLTIAAEGPHNITLFANDSFSNTGNATVSFIIDKTPPNLTIVSPNGSLVLGTSFELNYSLFDNVTSVHTVRYSLDGAANVTIANDTNPPTNTTINLTYPGSHFLIMYANDSANNLASKNVTFYSTAPMNMSAWASNTNITLDLENVNITNSSAELTDIEDANINTTLNLTLQTLNFNVSLVNFNGLNVNWGWLFTINESNTHVKTEIEAGSGSNVTMMLYLGEVSNFLNDSEYNATVKFEQNLTGLELYYCGEDDPSFSNCIKLNSISCTGFGNAPCYSNISNSVTVYVLHMSTVAVTNNTAPPIITINSPLNDTYTGLNGSTIYNMLANISFPADTSFCNYSLKGTTSKNESSSITLGTRTKAWTIGPLKNGSNYNITFWCKDASNYTSNFTTRYFKINDITAPNFISSTSTNLTENSAVIEWETDEYTNGTVKRYANDSCTGSPIGDSESDSNFSTKHDIEFIELSADTEYGYKITAYDYQGKSSISGCYYFVTDAATDSGDEESDSSTGGTTTNTTASLKETHFWDAISANSETTMDVKSSAIAIDILKFILKESVQGSQMSVQSYGTSVPPGLKAADNFVYQYFDITATFSSKLDLMRINLKIPKSWFTTNNYDPTKVEMYHSKNNTWINEFTEYDGLVGDYYTYHSEITSLSKFAISTVAAPPYVESCGNTICNQSAGENCSTCQTDCGPCVVINNTNTTNNLTTSNTSNDTNKTTFAFPKMDMEWLKQNRYIILGAVIITVFVALAVLVKSGLLPDEIKMPKIRRPRMDITLPKISRSTEKTKSKSDKKEKNFELEPGQFRLK